jgi:hypothetical protein
MKEVNQDQNELSTKRNSEIEAELLAISREERELDLEIKKEKVREIRAKKEASRDKVNTQRIAIEQFLIQRKLRQGSCNHRKGGIGAQAVLQGKGQSVMYAVVKHQLPVGKYFILCQRCGKEWHPALTALENAGTPQKATRGYFEALQYPTNNSESGSSRFDFRPTTEVLNELPEEEE